MLLRFSPLLAISSLGKRAKALTVELYMIKGILPLVKGHRANAPYSLLLEVNGPKESIFNTAARKLVIDLTEID
jgi:hypothetical protein